MKKAYRFISVAAVIALVFSLASCSLLAKKANFTQEVTAGNITVTLRDDMQEQTLSKSNDSYISGYRWNGYGMNIGRIEANDASTIRLSGQSDADILSKICEGGKNPTDVQKYGDFSYMDCTRSSDGKDYLSTVYLALEGYEYYFFEFYTFPEYIDKYREEYEKIVSSVRIIEEPAATADVTIEGVVFTVDGDAFEQMNGTWFCGRYSVTVMNTNLKAGSVSPEAFANELMKDFKTADGGNVTEIRTTEGGVPYFEGMADELYAFHYVKNLNGTLYYIMAATMVPTDEQLKPVFNEIVDGAHPA